MKKLILLLTFLPLMVQADPVEIGGIYYELYTSTAVVTVHPNGYSGDVSIPETVEYKGSPYLVTDIGYNAFSYCTNLTSITIPNSVSYIGDGAFVECTGLSSITIPNSVSYIGDWAFYGCTGLSSITIPNSVVHIGQCAFEECSGLSSVTMGNRIEHIEISAFAGCTNLTAVHISDLEAWCFIEFDGVDSNPLHLAHHLFLNGTEVTELDNYYLGDIRNFAFSGCTSLEAVSLHYGVGVGAFAECINLHSAYLDVETIGVGAFWGCENLTYLELSEQVTDIGMAAFERCEKLQDIYIPDNVVSIGNYAFRDCGYSGRLFVGNGLISIGEDAFDCCFFEYVHISDLPAWLHVNFASSHSNPLLGASRLLIGHNEAWGKLEIPNGTTSICDYSLVHCPNVTSVSIPQSVTYIGKEAFEFCDVLTSVNIPKDVISIGERAFEGCNNLSEISSYIENPFEIKDNVFPMKESATLYVPAGTKQLYQATPGWNFSKIVEMENIATGIGDVADGVAAQSVFNTNGQRINGMQKGLNILKQDDGGVIKVIVK